MRLILAFCLLTLPALAGAITIPSGHVYDEAGQPIGTFTTVSGGVDLNTNIGGHDESWTWTAGWPVGGDYNRDEFPPLPNPDQLVTTCCGVDSEGNCFAWTWKRYVWDMDGWHMVAFGVLY